MRPMSRDDARGAEEERDMAFDTRAARGGMHMKK